MGCMDAWLGLVAGVRPIPQTLLTEDDAHQTTSLVNSLPNNKVLGQSYMACIYQWHLSEELGEVAQALVTKPSYTPRPKKRRDRHKDSSVMCPACMATRFILCHCKMACRQGLFSSVLRMYTPAAKWSWVATSCQLAERCQLAECCQQLDSASTWTPWLGPLW